MEDNERQEVLTSPPGHGTVTIGDDGSRRDDDVAVALADAAKKEDGDALKPLRVVGGLILREGKMGPEPARCA